MGKSKSTPQSGDGAALPPFDEVVLIDEVYHVQNVPQLLTFQDAQNVLGRENGVVYGYPELLDPFVGDDERACPNGGMRFDWVPLAKEAESMRGKAGWRGNVFHTVWDTLVIDHLLRGFKNQIRFYSGGCVTRYGRPRFYRFVRPLVYVVPFDDLPSTAKPFLLYQSPRTHEYFYVKRQLLRV